MYFNTYPVTPDMGLRESINAMLQHVAFDQDSFGYRAPVVHASNYRSLLRDFSTLIEPVVIQHHSTLALVSKVSGPLADLVHVLVYVCNAYPLYDESDYSELEQSRLIEYVEQQDFPAPISPLAIARALSEEGNYENEYDGSVYVSQEHWDAALNTVLGVSA